MDENPYQAPTALADQPYRRRPRIASMVRLARFPLGAIAAFGGMSVGTAVIRLLNVPAGIAELGVFLVSGMAACMLAMRGCQRLAHWLDPT